jgi:hypothetical protein
VQHLPRGSLIKSEFSAFDFRSPPFVSTLPSFFAIAQASAAIMARWPALRWRLALRIGLDQRGAANAARGRFLP